MGTRRIIGTLTVATLAWTATAAALAAPTGTVVQAGKPGTGTRQCTAGDMAVGVPLEVKVGQMFMVGSPATGASAATLSSMRTRHIGNIFLGGRSTYGVATTAKVTAAFRGQATYAATRGTLPLISTDQEGGNVQVLRGSGFRTMPTALTQGGWSTSYLQSAATTWGKQLRSAGVNMNLAPVADTVPSSLGRANPPIGYWYREYNYSAAPVSASAAAFSAGMRAAGVATTAKHFPGLGLVRANTDTTANVHDTVTATQSTYLNPFKRAATDKVPFVMMSSAIYDKIDASRPAVFSSVVVGQVLRRQLGYTGIVMTDDIGVAKAMSPYSYATRGINSVNAGVQLLLVASPTQANPMYDAVLAKARSDQAFRAKINSASLAIFYAKAARGLLPKTCS